MRRRGRSVSRQSVAGRPRPVEHISGVRTRVVVVAERGRDPLDALRDVVSIDDAPRERAECSAKAGVGSLVVVAVVHLADDVLGGVVVLEDLPKLDVGECLRGVSWDWPAMMAQY